MNGTEIPPPREIISARRFPFPRDVVFEAFRDPARLAQWWGPAGFTNDFHAFEFHPGGSWRFTMHGPGGASYPMSQRFVEVSPPERIVYENLQEGHRFQMEMTLEAQDAETALTWRMRFESVEDFQAVKDVVAASNEQNFNRLESHLRSQT